MATRCAGSHGSLDRVATEAGPDAGRRCRPRQQQNAVPGESIEKRAAAAELRRNEILSRHAAQIENSLYPHKTLQEREIGGIYFYAKYGPPLIDRLIELANARCPEHKVLVLSN